MSVDFYDAVIVGAGISGISAAYHFQKQCSSKRYRILERRDHLGGTWDLFNYPGIRSDSDMYTFGFSFKPWSDDSAIAEKSKIIDYLHETTQEFGIDRHISYGLSIKSADWDSKVARWHLVVVDQATKKVERLDAQFLFMCTGYYDYEQGYQPEFLGQEVFKGTIVHPQKWPQELEHEDKNIVVIGSGATAITLIPSLAEHAAKVTMLQRSPTYMVAKPAKDPVANRIAWLFGRRAARWWFILNGMFIYSYCKLFAQRAKKSIIEGIRTELGKDFNARHFTPDYYPWDQRVCLCPDGDLFKVIKRGKAEIVTDGIDRFTEAGILLNSGAELKADIIVTATGLNMLFCGGIALAVDGRQFQAGDAYVYKGLMLNDVPNLFSATGYTNASWTLKVDLTNQYACRLINYLDRSGFDFCAPEVGSDVQAAPLLDLTSGYIQRSIDKFPKQATQVPWRLCQNYLYDKLILRFTSLKDKSIRFYRSEGFARFK